MLIGVEPVGCTARDLAGLFHPGLLDVSVLTAFLLISVCPGQVSVDFSTVQPRG